MSGRFMNFAAGRMQPTVVRSSPRQRLTTIPNKIGLDMTYEEAIQTLNSLQSNADTIKSCEDVKREHSANIDEAWKFLSRVGIGPKELHKLSVIHVAGTKGKGSTSTLCDSILRNHGYKTGLYTSPHLVSVTERIRLNGRALTRMDFAENFSHVYHQLLRMQVVKGEMPGYFLFLTIMALNIFIQEKVDVAIIEVGIGGQNDVTNVVSNVGAVGITSLGLEHTSILGNTIEQIAAEKGGIMNKGCRAYTVPQVGNAMEVLESIALRRQCPLNVVPNLSKYKWLPNLPEPEVLSSSPPLRLNASLAIQIAHAWIDQHARRAVYKDEDSEVLPTAREMIVLSMQQPFGWDGALGDCNIRANLPFRWRGFSKQVSFAPRNSRGKAEQRPDSKYGNEEVCLELPSNTWKGIRNVVIHGRCQILHTNLATYFLDGAHTYESVSICASWFHEKTCYSQMNALIFNTTGDRDPEPLLELLVPLRFQIVMFIPNVAFNNNGVSALGMKSDQYSNTGDRAMQKCYANFDIWNRLMEEFQNEVGFRGKSVTKVYPSFESALNYLVAYCGNNPERPSVLVTGSLHLVGAALTILDPKN